MDDMFKNMTMPSPPEAGRLFIRSHQLLIPPRRRMKNVHTGAHTFYETVSLFVLEGTAKHRNKNVFFPIMHLIIRERDNGSKHIFQNTWQKNVNKEIIYGAFHPTPF